MCVNCNWQRKNINSKVIRTGTLNIKACKGILLAINWQDNDIKMNKVACSMNIAANGIPPAMQFRRENET